MGSMMLSHYEFSGMEGRRGHRSRVTKWLDCGDETLSERPVPTRHIVGTLDR